MKIFKRRYTNWIPFGNYRWAGDVDFIVFVRKNKRNGMLQFKTRRFISWHKLKSPFVPTNLIDVKEQFDKIINQ